MAHGIDMKEEWFLFDLVNVVINFCAFDIENSLLDLTLGLSIMYLS
jgi:hypothetical protein